MRLKSNPLFWFVAFTVVLLSICLALFFHSSPSSFAVTQSNPEHLKWGLERIWFVKGGIFSFVWDLQRKHHHRYYCRKMESKIDPKWMSRLMSSYNVSLVLTVDPNGCGNFVSVQKAIDDVPDNKPTATIVAINPGIYKEKVTVRATKINVVLQGHGLTDTTIEWNDTAKSSGGTPYSATFTVLAPGFVAYNISFKNSAPEPPPGAQGLQAEAIRILGDKVAFYGCGFFGFQDTVGDEAGRHFFKGCIIEGTIDFIFGNARSLYEGCTINTVVRPGIGLGGSITAHKRASKAENTGFSFVNCNVKGTGQVWLGRAYGRFATVVFANTILSAVIAPEGWDNWRDPTRDSTIFFGEYKCTGPGAAFNRRAKYSKQLTPTDAAPFLDVSYINGKEWLKDVHLLPTTNDKLEENQFPNM